MRVLSACAVCLVALAAPAAAGCTTFEEDLNRSQKAFDQNEHERALAIMRQLESDQGRLSITDRAHYCYLRGMTDYRIGYRVESRHWLSLAAAIEGATPGSLPPDQVKRMNESLKEMNEAVYAGGVAALSNDVVKSKTPEDEEEGVHDSKGGETAPDKDKADKAGGDKSDTSDKSDKSDSSGSRGKPKQKKPKADDTP